MVSNEWRNSKKYCTLCGRGIWLKRGRRPTRDYGFCAWRCPGHECELGLNLQHCTHMPNREQSHCKRSNNTSKLLLLRRPTLGHGMQYPSMVPQKRNECTSCLFALHHYDTQSILFGVIPIHVNNNRQSDGAIYLVTVVRRMAFDIIISTYERRMLFGRAPSFE